MGLLSQEVYPNSSLVKADVSSYRLSSSGLPVANFQERAVEGNRLLVLGEAGLEEYGTEEGEVRLFQDPKGALPLSPVGAGARWRATKLEKPGYLSYQENIAVDRGGFIMARTIWQERLRTHPRRNGKRCRRCWRKFPSNRYRWRRTADTARVN